MTTLYGKRLMKSLVFSVLLVMVALLTFAAYTPAQDTGSLETECVVLATAGSFVVPEGLTPQEYCKAGVAFLGSEWLKAIQLQAVITLANDHDVRLAAAEATIAQLLADQGAMQAQIISNTARITTLEAAPINFQTQIDALVAALNGTNLKLSNAAAALQ